VSHVADLTFSNAVKNELARLLPEAECCRQTELAALVRACGRIGIAGAGRLSCTLSTDHAGVARKIIRLIKSGFGLSTVTMVMRRRRLKKNLNYMVRIPHQDGLIQLLAFAGVVDGEGNLSEWGEIPNLEQEHCRRAYLRGTFLGTGWISPPERQHHLEMSTISTEAADAVGQLLFRFGIPVRMLSRKEALVLYVKGAGQITHFLNVVGAHEALLRYEDVRALKEMKNLVNRQVNAETANLSKTVEASARQVEALEQFRASGAIKGLSPGLLELAQLRLSHPDASLKELGEMCSPPVSKSATNHRMRQLMQLATSSD
jgi:DNA-binding protein WhiA